MPFNAHKNDWFEFLNNQIPDQLPGEKVHSEMAPMRQLSSEALKEAKAVKESAVAIHLYEQSNDLQIVLTQRNTYKGAHSGQVSFPGGKRDDSDFDLIATARRESFEEIGLSVSEGKLIGSITEIYIPVSNFRVTPYVFFHEKELHDFIPDPREVKSIFSLPVSQLISEEIVQKRNIKISEEFTLKKVPCFIHEKYIIWGATAILLNEFKHIIRVNY